MATIQPAPPSMPPALPSPSVERPRPDRSAFGWLRYNLFRTPTDTLLTIIVTVLVAVLGGRVLVWALSDAKWAVVTDNLRVLMQGLYPLEQQQRVVIAVLLLVGLGGISWGVWRRRFRSIAAALFATILILLLLPLIERRLLGSDSVANYLNTQLLPLLDVLRAPLLQLIVLILLGYIAGRLLRSANDVLSSRAMLIAWLFSIPLVLLLIRGLTPDTPVVPLVPTSLWGGLLLTFMLAFVSMVACFPLGILLALGRTSGGVARRGERGLRGWWRSQGNYPIIKLFCTLYIELIRGIPLVTVLFTANLLVPLALGSAEIDAVVRAMVALTLFEAAYIAEIVRGGLQALPPGQLEAARAVGLNPVQATLLITLPQALRTVIPALVGQFITLFKDTSLVAIIGLLDLIGIGQSVVANPQYGGSQREIYVFIALVYFVICYAMSIAARQLERSGSGSLRKAE